MTKYIKKFEQLVTSTLMILMVLVVVLAVADLAWFLIKGAITPPILLLDPEELLEIFSVFLLVLIGIELVETLKSYRQNNEVRAEAVILVGIMALARKIITLDLKEVPGESMIGIAAIIVALAAAYFVIRKTHLNNNQQKPKKIE